MKDGFKIFDSHMHYAGIFKPKKQPFIEYLNNNGIDKAVVNTLNTKANLGILKGGAPQEFFRKMKEPDFNIFQDFSECGQPDHRQVIKLAKKYPDRIYPFFWYNPNDPNDPDQQKGLSLVEKHLDNGFCGVKLQHAMTPFKMKRLYPLAELLSEKKAPLFIHPTSGIFSTPPTDTFKLAKLAKRFPKLKIIVGHAAYTMEFAIECLLATFSCKNVYFETSVSIPYGIVTFSKIFGPRRVLFGSDSPSAGPFELEYKKILALRIPDKAKQQILYRNISRLLRIR